MRLNESPGPVCDIRGSKCLAAFPSLEDCHADGDSAYQSSQDDLRNTN